MSASPIHTRYRDWHRTRAGTAALARRQDLLRRLLSGWPRRSRSILVMNAGGGSTLETLWEAGFDVTAHESEPAYLAAARARLGNRASYVLGAPDHLPYDDGFFDYAAAVAAYEFWDDPVAVLGEMSRLAGSGLVLVVPNAWSLFGVECRFRRGPIFRHTRPLLQNPCALWRQLKSVCGKKKIVCASVLPGPSIFWRENWFCSRLNSPHLFLPLGALLGLRIDFAPKATGTPLVLRAAAPVATAE